MFYAGKWPCFFSGCGYGVVWLGNHAGALASFRKAYSRGKQSHAIAHWKWFEILHEPTDQLKQKIKIKI